MSERPDLTEAEALAAEHALGVLTAGERASAEQRMARDPAFAADVEAWHERLAPMTEAMASVAPPEGVWARIDHALPANDNALGRRLTFWRNSAVAGYALAAASLAAVVVQVNQPPTVIQAPSAQGQVLNASLMSQGDKVQPLFVAAYDSTRHALIITSLLPEGTDPQHVHELWLIHGEDKPMPLGFIAPGKSKMIALPKTATGMMAEGSALAVSVEAPGGSTSPDGPSGPVAAVGKLTKL
jgi:anti-sigma-K factor RskA